MAEDAWLPKKYRLPDGSEVKALLSSGDEWQVFDASRSKRILLVRPGLADKWHEQGFLNKTLLEDLQFGKERFQLLTSHRKYALEPVQNWNSPGSREEALAFASALKESRKLSQDVSFHDALYVEKHSRLLPTWTLTAKVEDELVLGTWLTGGVAVGTDSFRRLASLTGRIPVEDLGDVIRAAGLKLRQEGESPGNTRGRRKSAKAAGKAKTAPRKPKGKEFSLPGRPHLEKFFNEHIVDIIVNAEKYQAMGFDFPSSVVLYGPPGCGKTFAVEKLVEFIDWPSYEIDSGSIGSPYIHQTSQKISKVFDQAMENAPSVVIIDEMEAFLSDRQSGGSASHRIEEVAEFLRRIPEAIENRVLIIAMTNQIAMIDPAILRRGRFDHKIEVGPPSREEVASLVDALLDKLPKADDLNVEGLLDALAGQPLSDSSFVIREAARLAARAGKTQLDQESLNEALRNLPKKKSRKPIGFTRRNS